MDSVDLEVLKASARWLDEGHRALLVTVVKTWGYPKARCLWCATTA
jgi:xanthine dehydrogenase accessory factor